MRFIADLHIHSKYSRATAKNLDLEHLYLAAQTKGISLVGTGDFTHPAWMEEIETKLVEAEPGLFALRPEIAREMDPHVPRSCRGEVRFILQCEISNIYKKADRVRKNHNLIYFPDIRTAKQFNARLDAIGNIHSDGRPILGLDAEKLLEIMLETSDQGIFVPAHIWTPWFSMFGSKSGFDTMEECFGSLTSHIFAVETGLSSDPPMNWRVANLDKVRLISNSDAHSPGYLGRNASVFDTELDYFSLRRALEAPFSSEYLGTLDMYPEEGKYHFDGHRKCGVCLNPDETADLNNVCPECGRGMTLGVLHRVRELANRPEGYQPRDRHGHSYIIPLADILSEIFQVGPKTKKVTTHYQKAVETLGPELNILTRLDSDEIKGANVPLLAEAVEKMRSGEVHIHPGYDGEYGKVALFSDEERDILFGRSGDLFAGVPLKRKAAPKANAEALKGASASGERALERPLALGAGSTDKAVPRVDKPEAHTPFTETKPKDVQPPPTGDAGLIQGLNPDQGRAVESPSRAVLIQAGPGTGKTRTLTAKIAWLVAEMGVDPGAVLALTFTNKAARELTQRISAFLPGGGEVLAATFHGFCLKMLKEYTGFTAGLVEDELRQNLVAQALEAAATGREDFPKGKRAARQMDSWISLCKQRLLGPGDDLSAGAPDADPRVLAPVFQGYTRLLAQRNLVDFEDLIFNFHGHLTRDPQLLEQVRQRFAHIFIDEYQDLNQGQYELVRLISGENHITAIGDPDQSIYGFRGSDNAYFKRFAQDYPGCEQIRLSRNYRSTQTILDASFQMISRSGRVGDSSRIFSDVKTAQKLIIKETASEAAEVVAVGKMIESLMGGLSFHAMDRTSGEGGQERDYSFGDFAVLYRTRRQADAFIQIFQREGIPFQTADRTDWSRIKGIREILAVLRMALGRANPGDPALVAGHVNMEEDRAGEWVADVTGALWPGAATLDWLGKIRDGLGLENGLKARLEAGQAMDTLESLARTWDEPGAFLDALALNQDPDQLMPGVEKVSLMTLHSAKGLEFPVVFVTGCEEGLIPFARDGENCEDLDEERRLFYVAMTRAMDILCLTYAGKRRIYGTSKKRQRSHFIKDIESQLALYEQARAKAVKPVRETQMELF